MAREGCSAHQIEIALEYAKQNYMVSNETIRQRDNLNAYKDRLKELQMKKQIFEYYFDGNKEEKKEAIDND